MTVQAVDIPEMKEPSISECTLRQIPQTKAHVPYKTENTKEPMSTSREAATVETYPAVKEAPICTESKKVHVPVEIPCLPEITKRGLIDKGVEPSQVPVKEEETSSPNGPSHTQSLPEEIKEEGYPIPPEQDVTLPAIVSNVSITNTPQQCLPDVSEQDIYDTIPPKTENDPQKRNTEIIPEPSTSDNPEECPPNIHKVQEEIIEASQMKENVNLTPLQTPKQLQKSTIEVKDNPLKPAEEEPKEITSTTIFSEASTPDIPQECRPPIIPEVQKEPSISECSFRQSPQAEAQIPYKAEDMNEPMSTSREAAEEMIKLPVQTDEIATAVKEPPPYAEFEVVYVPMEIPCFPEVEKEVLLDKGEEPSHVLIKEETASPSDPGHTQSLSEMFKSGSYTINLEPDLTQPATVSDASIINDPQQCPPDASKVQKEPEQKNYATIPPKTINEPQNPITEIIPESSTPKSSKECPLNIHKVQEGIVEASPMKEEAKPTPLQTPKQLQNPTIEVKDKPIKPAVEPKEITSLQIIPEVPTPDTLQECQPEIPEVQEEPSIIKSPLRQSPKGEAQVPYKVEGMKEPMSTSRETAEEMVKPPEQTVETAIKEPPPCAKTEKVHVPGEIPCLPEGNKTELLDKREEPSHISIEEDERASPNHPSYTQNLLEPIKEEAYAILPEPDITPPAVASDASIINAPQHCPPDVSNVQKEPGHKIYDTIPPKTVNVPQKSIIEVEDEPLEASQDGKKKALEETATSSNALKNRNAEELKQEEIAIPETLPEPPTADNLKECRNIHKVKEEIGEASPVTEKAKPTRLQTPKQLQNPTIQVEDKPIKPEEEKTKEITSLKIISEAPTPNIQQERPPKLPEVQEEPTKMGPMQEIAKPSTFEAPKEMQNCTIEVKDDLLETVKEQELKQKEIALPEIVSEASIPNIPQEHPPDLQMGKFPIECISPVQEETKRSPETPEQKHAKKKDPKQEKIRPLKIVREAPTSDIPKECPSNIPKVREESAKMSSVQESVMPTPKTEIISKAPKPNIPQECPPEIIESQKETGEMSPIQISIQPTSETPKALQQPDIFRVPKKHVEMSPVQVIAKPSPPETPITSQKPRIAIELESMAAATEIQEMTPLEEAATSSDAHKEAKEPNQEDITLTEIILEAPSNSPQECPLEFPKVQDKSTTSKVQERAESSPPETPARLEQPIIEIPEIRPKEAPRRDDGERPPLKGITAPRDLSKEKNAKEIHSPDIIKEVPRLNVAQECPLPEKGIIPPEAARPVQEKSDPTPAKTPKELQQSTVQIEDESVQPPPPIARVGFSRPLAEQEPQSDSIPRFNP